ncbi:MAG: hypothetical protein JWO86_7635, partial [Myxococcaceae bacterium]|nr:hypothetical protein [Myxococcaceae bacterium]
MLAVTVLAVAHAGCGNDAAKELFTRPFDAGADADATDERIPTVDETLGGPCNEDVECDDAIACTFDACDQTVKRCRNTPDDAQCADPLYCNGREKCVIRLGCAAGPVVTCQDDNPCTIDRCVESTKSCEHNPRDVDGDGDPDNHCVAMRDCDDLDPAISSAHSEVCGNFKDDNCNGEVDEVGCVQAANDVCATALAVKASGTFLVSTVATKRDYPTVCPSVATPAAAQDVVLTITVPGAAGGPLQDVEVWATAESSKNEVAVALRTNCTAAASEIGCGHIAGAASARAIARGVAPGTAIHAIVTTQQEGAVDVKVDIRGAAPKPTNESCAAPQPVAVDAPFTASLIDPDKDVPSACDKVQTGELTYAFTLAQPSDVRVFASTLVGSGEPVVSLRDASCTDELRCRASSALPLFARNLAAGPHVLTVAGTTQLDASILVKTYPPTTAPPNQSCATAPPIAFDTTIAVDLSSQEDAIKNGCLPGGPAAAYTLTLTQPSDVLVIGRFPMNESGAVAINGPACTTADLVAPCTMGQTPQRVSKRNLAAGTYRVVIADELGQTAQLSVLVRPTVPPTTIGVAASDNCSAVFPLPAAGGFFTGDTTGATADFSAGCDAPGQPIGGAKDQLLKLDLAQKQRVVFDMTGSFYTTILDVRQGVTCPGTEVPSACYVGFNAGKSFLDLTLASGTYWVQVDGYNGDRGPWNLDMRV